MAPKPTPVLDADDPYATNASPAPDTRRRSRRRWIIGGTVAAVLVAAAAFVLVVFQPQKLFIDDVVDEDLPGLVVAGAAPADAPPTPEPAPEAQAPVTTVPPAPIDPLAAALAEAQRTGAPVAVTAGEFASLDHPTSGRAYLVVQPDGSRILRIEDLDTDNGPDLRVVLSTAEVGSGSYDDLVELGRLKGNIGNQNYEIPADLDLTTVRSVVIWCERFSSAFGEAPALLPG
jgi:hypothetical protein